MSSNSEIKEETVIETPTSFEILRDTLKMKRKLREREHLNLLAKNLHNLKYFKNLICEEEERVDFVRECAKHLKYKLYPKGSEVFKKGDKGQNFYIIFKGTALIFVPRDSAEIEKDSFNEERKNAVKFYAEYIRKAQNKNNNISSQQTQKSTFHSENQNLVNKELAKKMLSEDYCPIFQGKVFQSLNFEDKLLLLNDTHPETLPYYIRETPVFKKVNTLREGDYFGELALIFNQPRMASVIASEDLHVLSVKGSAYKQVFASEVGNITDKVQFFKKIFTNVNQVDILKFCFLLQEQSFHFNTNVTKEGETPEAVYFIKEGHIQLSKFSRPAPQDQKKKIVKQSLPHRRIIAADLFPGSFFGDLDSEKDSKVAYTATCQTSTRFYILKNSTFRIIKQHFPKIAKNLQDFANVNQHVRNTRVQNNEKLQFSNQKVEIQAETIEQYAEEAKIAELKLRTVYRKSHEVLPLHYPSKFDASSLDQESEREHLHSNIPKERVRKSSIFSNSILSGKDSMNGTTNLTPKAKDISINMNFLSPRSQRDARRLSEALSDHDFSPSSGGSLTPKVVLPSIHSPKSSFSGMAKEVIKSSLESQKINLHIAPDKSHRKRPSLNIGFQNFISEREDGQKNLIVESPNQQTNPFAEVKRLSSVKQFIISRAHSFRSLRK